MNYNDLSKEVESYVIAMRRHFHETPELSSEEENTVKKICEELENMGIEHVNVENGGVIAFLGDKSKGKTVLLRADIDALPVKESKTRANGVKKPAVSTVDGVAHTCGHDCHTAMLLGAAKILSNNQDQINGRIILMFERGEEGTGNLVYLHKYIEEENLEIDTSFGMHVFPFAKSGEIMIFDDITMAGSLGFNVKIIGRSAHGSEPNNGISPIDCFHNIYSAMNMMRMKYASPFNPMVFSVGSLHAGKAGNVIPGELTFAGSFRLFDHENGLRIKEELINIFENTAKTFHCEIEYTINGPSLGLVNDVECSQFAQKVFEKHINENCIVKTNPLMGSESHSATAKIWPGTFVGIGIYDEQEGTTALIHHECFDVTESSLKVGVAAHVSYAIEFLASDIDTTDRKYKGTMKEFYNKYVPKTADVFS